MSIDDEARAAWEAVLTEEIKRESADSGDRFDRLVARDADPLVMVLKGHLLLEEDLQQIIDAWIPNSKLLRERRWSFGHRAALCKGICDKWAPEWLWNALEELNSVRNKLVHRSEPGELAGLLRDFERICDDSLSKDSGLRRLPGGTWRAILRCWSVLHTLTELFKAMRGDQEAAMAAFLGRMKKGAAEAAARKG